MTRISNLCAAAALAVTAFVATSPAKADYHLIRWNDSGFCQVWDNNVPNLLAPYIYTTASTSVPTLYEALADKEVMLRSGACRF